MAKKKKKVAVKKIAKKKALKKVKEKKMSLLSQRKNINDKFFDVVSANIKNENKKGKWKRTGVKQLAKELEISVSTLDKYIKRGFINEKDDELFINVERNFDKLKIKRTKKVTKEFNVHTFTRDNFFKRKPFGKIKPNEQLYFRAGLYMVFKTGKNGTYTIQNLPISHYSSKYPQGYTEFFELIRIRLNEHPSLKYFRFNYFDVKKVYLDSIEERIQNFQNKNKGKTKKKK